MDYLIWIGIFYIGFFAGYFLHVWARRQSFGGTIYIIENEGKTLYSLELDEYPDGMISKKEITFKVNASEKKSQS